MHKIPLRIQIYNRWTLFQCSPEVQQEVKPLFAFQVPGAEFSQRFRDGEWDGYKNMFSRGRVATGLFLEQRAELEKVYRLRVQDFRVAPVFRTIPFKDSRPYQQRAVETMVAASTTGGLILSATGSGKTRIAGDLFQRLEGCACFIADELALLEQSRIAIEKVLNETVGVVGRSEFKPKRITVATIQTLAKHCNKHTFKKWFSSLNVLIIDEIHTALNRRNIDVVSQIRPQAVFGLTATLEMQKPHIHMPAVALAGPVIFEYPIQEGVKEGFLSEGVICRVLFHDPLKGKSPGYQNIDNIWIKAGGPEADYRYHIALNKSRNDCIEALVREGLKRGRKVVVLVERKNHLAVLSKRLQDIKHKALSGDVPTPIRMQAMKDMDAGILPLILASVVFRKGVDVSRIDLIVDATGSPGRNSALQRYGRGARKVEGKMLWYVDISDRGSTFEGAAKARAFALTEIGAKALEVTWNNNAEKIFNQLEREAK